MAKSNWTQLYLYKSSLDGSLRMVSEDRCSATVWVGKKTDVHRAAVVARDRCRGVSVTHMAEDMITFLEKTFLEDDRFRAEETLWIYRDAAGHWDQIQPRHDGDGMVVTITPVGDRTVVAVKSALLAHGFNVNDYPLRELLQERLQ